MVIPGLIVTAEVVLLHPPKVGVKVKVAVPEVNPVTKPVFVTDATEGLLLIQVPPVVGDKLVVLPTQMEELPVILIVGKETTVIVATFDSFVATKGFGETLLVLESIAFL